MGSTDKHYITYTIITPRNGSQRRKVQGYQEIRQERWQVQIQNHQEEDRWQEEEGRQEEGRQEEDQEGQEDPHCRQEVAGLEGYPRQDRRWPYQEGPLQEQERQDCLQ